MQDRVPLYPGRVTLTPVAGQANTYDMTRADQPTQEGTPLNKATLLKDYTANLLGLPNTAVPDDALLALIIGVGAYGYRVKIQLADGTPAEGATVSGIEALTGSTLVSGANGIVLGKSTSQTVTIGCISPYIDQAAPASQRVTATGTITDVTLTLINITDTITVTSSKTSKISSMAKTVDICAVGGGGGGSGVTDPDYQKSYGGGGGGGGNIVNVLAKSLTSDAKKSIKIIVGSGGAGGGYSGKRPSGNECNGSSGGTTSVFLGEQTEIATATGGGGGQIGLSYDTPGSGGTSMNGGSGGNGGYGDNSRGSDGNSSKVHIFNDYNLGLAGGGGGAGSGYVDSIQTRPAAGLPNGGLGGAYVPNGTNEKPENGKPFGGGGGAESRGSWDKTTSGANGGVYLRFHFS